MNKDTIIISFALIIFVPLVLVAILSPERSGAFSLFTPFGGRVTAYSPEAPGCSPITVAVSAATLGTVNITFEEIVVGPPRPGTFSIIRINGKTVPGLTKIYNNYLYFKPGAWVLGDSLDLCVFPGVRDLLGDTVADTICAISSTTCPITRIVHRIGSGGLGF